MFKDKKASRDLINYILDNINAYKPNIGNIDEAIDSEEYYEMPLLEASFAQTVAGNIKKNGIKGVATGF